MLDAIKARLLEVVDLALMPPSKYSLQEKPEVRILVPGWHMGSESWRRRAEIRSDRPWRDDRNIWHPQNIAR